jgi:hypothetical protein
MCANDTYLLCVLVRAILTISPPTNMSLICPANLSTIVSGMLSPRMNRREQELNYIKRFPALAYGTLVAVLAGWKGIQRYRQGNTSLSNGQWLLDIFIRQVISTGRMVSRTC